MTTASVMVVTMEDEPDRLKLRTGVAIKRRTNMTNMKLSMKLVGM